MRQIGRRPFLIAASALLTPNFALAQTTGRPRVVGLLSPFPMPSPEVWVNTAFSKRLRELGWIEGTNIIIEQARSDGRDDRLPALAEELVRRKVDVIYAVAPDAAVIAARATKTIPIVFWGVALPVEQGLVTSLARPTGNVTGVTFNAGAEIQLAKPLEFLKQIVPSATRLAVIYSSVTAQTVSGATFTYPDLTAAISGLGFKTSVHTSERDEDLDAMFASILDARAQSILALAVPFTTRIQRHIAEFAGLQRLPTASDSSQFVERGMLISQGPDIPETTRRAVDFVDRILRGARPADLPVEMPRKFEVAVNLKTAKMIGVTVPQSIILSADKVIQ
jgi:putative tryptophan/tyrosine transport system substrate-binding protein